jgi:uncharacterized repeat protein (TIGR02543 family)
VLPDGVIIRPNPDNGRAPVLDRATGEITVWVRFVLTEGRTFDGGLTYVDVPQLYGAAVLVPQLPLTPIVDGRAFDVWVDSFGVPLATPGATVDEAFVTKSFYSLWKTDEGNGTREPNLWVITFDPQGGVGGTAFFHVPLGADLTNVVTLAAPSRHGYHFSGYWTEVSDGDQLFDSRMSGTNDWQIAQDITLYAHWTARSFDYAVYSPIVYVTSGAVTDKPGVFDTIDDPAFDDVTFTLAPGSAPLPGSLRIVSGGGLVGAATTELESESFKVIIRATDTATGRFVDREWTIVVIKPGVAFGGANITAIFVSPEKEDGTHDVTLHYLEVSGEKSQTILGKVNLTDRDWVDLTADLPAGSSLSQSEIGPHRAVISGAVRDSKGNNFRFFKRRVLF